MIELRKWLFLLLPLGLGACTNHLVFVEESHFGLKADFSGTNVTPYEFDLSYRRGIVALIPQQKGSAGQLKTEIRDQDNTVIASYEHDPAELTSLFVLFRANIGFNDPIELHHFMATGWASVLLASRKDALESVQEEFVNRVSGATPKESAGGEKKQ